MRTGMVAAIAALASVGSAHADSYYWPAPTGYSANPQTRFFTAGTPVLLRTETDISTKTTRAGDRVYLRVAEPLAYKGQVVIPAGAPAVAEVVRADRNGHLGRKGKLNIQLLYIQTPMGQVPLGGGKEQFGRSGTALSVGTMLFVSTLGGFLIHGTSATIPYGSFVQAFTAEPLRFLEQVHPARSAGTQVPVNTALAMSGGN